jgi:phosphoribosylglycinamide formyltransferase-1
MSRMKLGVLISGRGTNLQSLIDACADTAYPAQIALVISNRADAYGLERAKKAGIATAVIPHTDYDGREAFDAAIGKALNEAGVELLCLAGFMRIFSERFATEWEGRMLNIHPSLLPAFKGLHPQRQALQAGVAISGCTVHYVTPELDSGPIVGQAAVPVMCDDTEETLSARILEAEHKLYPLCVRMLATGEARYHAGRVIFARPFPAVGTLINPSR